MGWLRARVRDPLFRFTVVFGVLAVSSELFYYAVALESEGFQVYLHTLAQISGALMGLLHTEVTVIGARISNPQFAVEVAQGCDAYRICSLLVAAILAFPAPVKTKVYGLVFGLVWLNALNFARIISLFFIGAYTTGIFQTAHEVVWPTLLIIMTVATWIIWVRQATRDEARAVEHPA